MTQPDNTPEWLTWIAPLAAAIGVIWAFLRRLFSYVTREEFQDALDKRHQENKEAISGIYRRMDTAARDRQEMRDEVSRIAEDVAYLRGRGSR